MVIISTIRLINNTNTAYIVASWVLRSLWQGNGDLNHKSLCPSRSRFEKRVSFLSPFIWAILERAPVSLIWKIENKARTYERVCSHLYTCYYYDRSVKNTDCSREAVYLSPCFILFTNRVSATGQSCEDSTPFPGGVLPYMGYIGMCRGIGYGFWGSRSLNRVSFLTLLLLCSWCGPLIG